MKKLYIIVTVIVLVILCVVGALYLNRNEEVLLSVNGQEITKHDLKLMKERYSHLKLTDDEILEEIVLEELTLQYARKNKISIDEKAVDESILQIKKNKKLYAKVIESYRSEIKYREALADKKLYDAVEEKISQDALEQYKPNELVIEEKTRQFTKEAEFVRYNPGEVNRIEHRNKVKDIYLSNVKKRIENMYFSSWQESLIKKANIEVKEKYRGKIFKNKETDTRKLVDKLEKRIDSERDEKDFIDALFLKPDVFKVNKYYSSDLMKVFYYDAEVKSDTVSHITLEWNPAFRSKNDEISYDYDEKGKVLKYEDAKLGIRISLHVKKGKEEAYQWLLRNSLIIPSSNELFISYTPVRHGIIDYYYPEGTVVEEEWDYSKAKKYVGVDFLKKLVGFKYADEGHDDLFTMSVRNKTPYWTVTRDKKTNKILLDNFGMVYKGKNNKEIVVAVAKGKFPFLYDDIEFEDAKMSYINGYPMYLGENQEYNESLYAKFSKDNICYIIWTQHMSKDELQELVKQYLS